LLRIYLLQRWFNPSGPAAEDAICDSESMRRFAKVELAEDKIPDESTILRFRHLLEKHTSDGGNLRGRERSADRASSVFAVGDDRGRDDHRSAELDEERHEDAGTRR